MLIDDVKKVSRRSLMSYLAVIFQTYDSWFSTEHLCQHSTGSDRSSATKFHRLDRESMEPFDYLFCCFRGADETLDIYIPGMFRSHCRYFNYLKLPNIGVAQVDS